MYVLTSILFFVFFYPGVEGGIVVAKCENKEWGFGYDAATGEYTDLLKSGVIDPAKVHQRHLRPINTINRRKDGIRSKFPPPVTLFLYFARFKVVRTINRTGRLYRTGSPPVV